MRSVALSPQAREDALDAMGAAEDKSYKEANNLVRIKDALLATAAATGLASIASGLQLTRQAPDGAVPIDSGVSPAPEMSDEAARLLRRVNMLGNVNIAVLGGVIAVSTILSMKANESVRWSLLSRILP